MPGDRRQYTKTRPLQDAEFDECRALWAERPVTERSWRVPVGQVVDNEYNLDIKNPASSGDAWRIARRKSWLDSILAKEQQIAEIMMKDQSSLECRKMKLHRGTRAVPKR